jgi:hypothetical protein
LNIFAEIHLILYVDRYDFKNGILPFSATIIAINKISDKQSPTPYY